MQTTGGTCGCLEWTAAFRAAPGEQECGDALVVRASAERTVVAVADGLGHGREAALSAQAALECIQPSGEGPTELLRAAHERLRRLRGVALGIAVLRHGAGRLRWVGVGNVEGALRQNVAGGAARNHRFFVQPGLVGHRVATLREIDRAVMPEDLLVITTDGVAEDFLEDLVDDHSLERMARRVLQRHARTDDDATVLIARLREAGP